ncbi:MAG: metallophosphoesterase [Verrucomicrobiia bacterium]
MSDVFRFAVIGDCHFVSPKYHAEENRDDAYRRYAWMMENVWPRLLAEIAAEKPAFLVQLGDFVEGSRDPSLQSAELREALGLLRGGCGCPVWFVKGNHDREPALREVVMPELRERLLALAGGKGRPLTTFHYAFDHGDTRFIVVDDVNLRPGSPQAAWLEAELKGAKERGARTFLFSHAPLFTVGRPFWGLKPMLDVTLPLLDRCRVDAFFCGHSHNHAATLHRNVRNPLLQLETTILGYPQAPLVPLHEVRPSAVSRHSYDYLWGFVEDCAPSWYLITVAGSRVRAEWRLLGRDASGVLEWSEAGRVVCAKRPESPPRVGLGAEELRDVREARVFMAGYKCFDPEKRVLLNGVPIGGTPPLTCFDCHMAVAVPPEKLSALALENEIVIENPHGEKFLVGSFYIEARLGDGRLARSTVSQEVYATCGDWDGWSSPILRHVAPGKPIRVEGLVF